MAALPERAKPPFCPLWVAAFISGAGPTVLALHTGDESEVAELARAAGEKFEAKAIEVSPSGAVIL